MATINVEMRKDGKYLRYRRLMIPFSGGQVFYRRYAISGGLEYEIIGSFYCKFLIEFRHPDRPSFFACLATDNGAGEMELIPKEFLLPLGAAHICKHTCAYKKLCAEKILGYKPADEQRLRTFLMGKDTITLNTEVIEFGREF